MTLFWLLAPVMVLAAVGMVLSRKAVHSALMLAVVMIGLAWFLPTLTNLFAGQSPRLPSLLMVLALLTLALSWHLLY